MIRRYIKGKTACCDAGLTLIEMLVVLGIVAVVLAIAMPRFAISDRMQLSSFVSQVAAELRATRAAAISRNAQTEFALDVQARTMMSTAEPRRRQLPNFVDASLVAAKDYVRPTSGGAIVFFSDGSSSGGTLSMRTGVTAMKITVDWLSGQIEIEDLNL